jgi:DNA polymerase-3 subunit beta
MKFSIDRSEFTLGVNTVCKAISSRTTLPILENLYLAIQNNQIVMRGNDLELGIAYVLPIKLEDHQAPSGVLLKANTLNEILSKLNSDTVDIDLNELLKCNIKSSAIDFDIHGISVDEYPQFPTIEKNIQFDIDSSILLDLIKHTIFSVSYDETKQFLNGIKIECKGNQCDFISTDGFRLSLKYEQFEKELPEFSCIVPFKTMHELSKILTLVKSESVQLFLSERQISFKVGAATIISRLINGRFPDYKQVMPKNTLFEYKISRQLLLSAAERANIIASHSNFVAKFKFTETLLTISASNAKLGDYNEQLDVNRHLGDRDITVSFNIKLLQEALKIIDQQDVIFEINSELSPCVIKPVGDQTYTHILMPIRMSEFSNENDAKVAPSNEPQPVAS